MRVFFILSHQIHSVVLWGRHPKLFLKWLESRNHCPRHLYNTSISTITQGPCICQLPEDTCLVSELEYYLNSVLSVKPRLSIIALSCTPKRNNFHRVSTNDQIEDNLQTLKPQFKRDLERWQGFDFEFLFHWKPGCPSDFDSLLIIPCSWKRSCWYTHFLFFSSSATF